MKSFNYVLIAAFATFASVSAVPAKGGKVVSAVAPQLA